MLAISLLTQALLAAPRPAPKTLRTRQASCACGISTTTSTLCRHLSTVCLSTQGPFRGCPLGTRLPGQGCHTSAQRQTSPSRSSSLVRRSLCGCKQSDVGVCICLGFELRFRAEPGWREKVRMLGIILWLRSGVSMSPRWGGSVTDRYVTLTSSPPLSGLSLLLSMIRAQGG